MAQLNLEFKNVLNKDTKNVFLKKILTWYFSSKNSFHFTHSCKLEGLYELSVKDTKSSTRRFKFEY